MSTLEEYAAKMERERVARLDRESAYEKLRATLAVLDNTSSDAFSHLNEPTALLALVRACRYCPWDITPCDLTREEREYAQEHGRLPVKAYDRLKARLG